MVKMSYLSKPYQKSFIGNFVIEALLHLKYNAQFISDELDWNKYTAYHIVLPWAQIARISI